MGARTGTRTIGRLALLVVLAVTAASCGSDDSDTSDTAGADATAAAGTEAPGTDATAATATDAAGTTGGEGASGETDDIVIGDAAGQTGFLEAYDGPIANFAQLAIDDINAAGGVNGRMLTMIKTDMKSDPTLSETAALEAIEQGADFILTACDFDMGGGAARAAAAAKKVAVGCAGATTYGYEGFGDAGKYIFNTYVGNATTSGAMAQFVVDRGWTKPFFLADTSLSVMTEACASAEDVFKELTGGEAAGRDSFANGDESIATQVAAIEAADPDVIVMCSYPPGGASAVRQIRSVTDAPIISDPAMEGEFWLEAVPNLSNMFAMGLADYTGGDPNAQRQELFDRYKEQFGSTPPTIGLTGYMAIQALATAVERAGSTDGDAVAAEMSKFTNEDFITGPVTYTETCHIPLGQPLVVMEIADGKPKYAGTVTPTKLPDLPC